MGVFKKGKNWYIDYYIKGRRKREKSGPSRRQAELVFQKRRVQIAEEKFFEIKRSEKILFDDFAEMYINTYSKPNKRSWVRDQNCIDHLKLFFENKYLHEITRLSIEQYKKLRMNEVSPRTVNIELSCLKATFIDRDDHEVLAPFTESQTNSSREIVRGHGHYLDTRPQRRSI